MTTETEVTVDKKQVKLALTALLAHLQSKKSELKKKDELFEKEDTLWLLLSFKKIPQVDSKPRKIPLPHPINNEKEICLISKEPGKKVKELLQEKGVTNITKVISLVKLRKEYKTFQLKRQLFSTFDIFLCDDRVFHLASKTLGKEFIKRKKEPLPIRLTVTDIQGEIKKTLQSTLLRMGHGPCTAVKVGSISKQNEQELLENLLHAIKISASKVPGSWANIQCLHVKTSATCALPIYQSLPEVVPPAFEIKELEVEKKSRKRKKQSKSTIEEVFDKENNEVESEINKNIEVPTTKKK